MLAKMSLSNEATLFASNKKRSLMAPFLFQLMGLAVEPLVDQLVDNRGVGQC